MVDRNRTIYFVLPADDCIDENILGCSPSRKNKNHIFLYLIAVLMLMIIKSEQSRLGE